MALLSIGSVSAQHRNKKNPEGKVKAMVSQLGLSAEVAEKVKAIMASQAPKAEALKQSLKTATDKKSVRKEMKALNDETNTQLQGVLTADQFAKYQELRKKEMMPKKDGDKKPKNEDNE